MNYLLYGEERSLMNNAIKRLTKDSGGDSMMNTVTYDLANQTLLEALDDALTIPFFSEHKVVIVKHADFLCGSGEAIDGIEALERYLKQPMESTTLILTGDFPKLDSRKKIVKTVQKTCKVLPFQKLDDLGANNYLKEQIKIRNLQFEVGAYKELQQRVSSDVGEITHALNKLVLLNGIVEKKDVEALVLRNFDDNVFDLVDAVVKKQVKRAFHLWRDLSALNQDAIYLTAILASQFRFLYQVKRLQMQGFNDREITQTLGAHPFRIRKSLEMVHVLGIKEILKVLSSLADLDQKIKSGKIDKVLGFELFLLQI